MKQLTDEQVFASTDVMSVNAELGLPMWKLMPLVRAIEAESRRINNLTGEAQPAADDKAGGEVVGYANAGDIEQMRQHGGATLLWSDAHDADDDLVPIYTRPQPQAESAAWRDHVEQRLFTWRRRIMNRDGDQLALDDFMDKESIDDLLDYVLDEYANTKENMK